MIKDNNLNLAVTSTRKVGNLLSVTVQNPATTYGEPKYCPRDSSYPTLEVAIAASKNTYIDVREN